MRYHRHPHAHEQLQLRRRSRLPSFNGQTYGDAGPYYAVDRIGNADHFDYDPNGNMVVRNQGLSSRQTPV